MAIFLTVLKILGITLLVILILVLLILVEVLCLPISYKAFFEKPVEADGNGMQAGMSGKGKQAVAKNAEMVAYAKASLFLHLFTVGYNVIGKKKGIYFHFCGIDVTKLMKKILSKGGDDEEDVEEIATAKGSKIKDSQISESSDVKKQVDLEKFNEFESFESFDEFESFEDVEITDETVKKTETSESESEDATKETLNSEESELIENQNNFEENLFEESEGFEETYSEEKPMDKRKKRKGLNFGGISSKIKSLVEKIKSIFEKLNNLKLKIKGIFKNLKRSLLKLKNKITETIDFLNSDEFSKMWEIGKELLIKILKHIAPRKFKCDFRLGTGEPDTTGMVFGAIACASGATGVKVKAVPDFEEKVFEGYAELKGRIVLIYLIVIAVKVYLSDDYKAFNKRLKRYKAATR